MNNKKKIVILSFYIFLSVLLFNYDAQIFQQNVYIENGVSISKSVESPLIWSLSKYDLPNVLDPVDIETYESNDIIRHVCDNLWYYDLSSGPDFMLEFKLATGYFWDFTMTNLTVTLREGVYFHDGSYFNATAVKFTFDRILYFINATGNLPGSTHISNSASLFFDMFGKSILNKTVINSEYNITFVLNKPSGIFMNLLTYDACAILHPNSTPATTYLELEADILVGTGPFVYEGYIPDVQIGFHTYEYYWDGQSWIEEIIFQVFPDSITATNALLTNNSHFLGNPPTSLISTLQANEDLVFINLNTSNIYRYWGFNNIKINKTNVRKAIAYAYNYTYYIDVIRLGYMIRAEQFLSPGFPYYNASFTAPYYNTTIARQAMIDEFPSETAAAGCTAEAYGVNPTNDAIWEGLTLASYKVLEHEGWTTGQDMNAALTYDLDKIGIEITPDIMDWAMYQDVISHDENRLEIFHTGWSYSYIEPFSMIEPLLNIMSDDNHIQLQDAQIMDWLAEYEETDPANTVTRTELIWKIQNRAINELYCQLPTANDMFMIVHHENLTGFPYNVMNYVDFYPCNGYFSVPGTDYPPTSNHPEDLVTTLGGLETIDWILYDEDGGGQYRVWVNDTNGNYYVWVDWTPWTNNTVLNVPINRTTIGIFNYVIEYYDNNNQFGNADTVLVTISDMIPTSNHPEDLITTLRDSETIDWILYDDSGGGQYRVWLNDANGDYYVWVNWTPWTNNTVLNVPINSSIVGIFNYTIEYYDKNNQFGNPDTVIVVINEENPSSIPGLNVILISIMLLFTITSYVYKIQKKKKK